MRCFEDDGNGREVCDVGVDGTDVGLEMIRAGLAWHFKRFQDEQDPMTRLQYAEAEIEARERRRSIWNLADPMPPWECRRVKRKGGVCR